MPFLQLKMDSKMDNKIKVLIPTEPDDNHAVLVKLALEAAGHHVRLLFTADLPTRQKNSVFINGKYHWRSADEYDCVMDNNYDVVWWRRARKPYISKSAIHPEDYKFVVRENDCFFESIMNNLAPNAWWINPKMEATRANYKLFQLRMALESQLKIPLTLCSNDPNEIRKFLSLHQSEGIIFKPLSVGVWFEEHSMKLAYTSKITDLHLPQDHLLQLVPGIYQKEIKKAFELRVVCFGDYIIATKLHSQNHEEGTMDWRAIPYGELKLEPYYLSNRLQEKIRVFMRKMGLVFGSLDLIVTPEGETIFLEVNEQGQFLWLEAYHPDIKILDIFIQFLLSRTIHFQWNETRIRHSVLDYQEELDAIIEENLSRHVYLNGAQSYKEDK